jgi:hypothetical protein
MGVLQYPKILDLRNPQGDGWYNLSMIDQIYFCYDNFYFYFLKYEKVLFLIFLNVNVWIFLNIISFMFFFLNEIKKIDDEVLWSKIHESWRRVFFPFRRFFFFHLGKVSLSFIIF